MSLLRLVDLLFHKARLVCSNTRNCTLCCAGASRLQTNSALEKRAETLMLRRESARIRNEFPSLKLENFQDQDWILWSTGRFDSSTRFKCEDAEMDLPFYDDSEIAPVVPVVRDRAQLFYAYTLHVHLKIRPHSGVETYMKEINRKCLY